MGLRHRSPDSTRPAKERIKSSAARELVDAQAVAEVATAEARGERERRAKLEEHLRKEHRRRAAAYQRIAELEQELQETRGRAELEAELSELRTEKARLQRRVLKLERDLQAVSTSVQTALSGTEGDGEVPESADRSPVPAASPRVAAQEPQAAASRPGGPAGVGECWVCGTTRRSMGADELAASGWVVKGRLSLCPSCRTEGWDLRSATTAPIRRMSPD
jgi:DNA repair exonuclease SbcCD ATPase subunit